MLALAIGLICSIGQTAGAQDQTRYWNLSWSWDKVDVGKLIDRLDSVGLEIPVDAKGDATVDVQVGIPLNALRSPEKYRLKGKIAAKRLEVDKLVCEDFSALINVDNGVAELTRLQTTLGSTEKDGSGSVTGSAQLQFAPRGRFSADLVVDKVNVTPIHQVYLAAVDESKTTAFGGRVDGSVKFSAPFDELSDVATWSLDGDISLQDFRSDQFPPINLATGPIKIVDGDLQARDVRVVTSGSNASTLMLAVHAELKELRRFELAVVGDDIPITEIANLFSAGGTPIASGQIDLDLKASGKLGNGKLAELSWQVDGQLASPSLNVAGVDLGLLEHTIHFDPARLVIEPIEASDVESLKLNRLAANFKLSADSLTLESLDAELFGGGVAGQASWSLQDTGQHRVDLKWHDLSLRVNTAMFTPVGVEVGANTSGSIDWRVPVAGIAQIDQHRGELDVKLSDIMLGDAVVGTLVATAKAKGDTLAVDAKGELLGGEFSIQTSKQIAPGMTWSQLTDVPSTGEVVVSGVQVAKALALIPEASKPKILRRRWEAQMSSKLDWSTNETVDFRWATNLIVENVLLDGVVLVRRLEADARLVDERIVLDQLVGLVAGGRVDANGGARFDSANGRFGDAQLSVRLAHLSLTDLLSPVSTNLSEQLIGKLSGRITVSGSDRNRVAIRGSSRLTNANLFGLQIDEVHGSLSGWVTNTFDRWRFDLDTISGVAGDGRVTGDLMLKSANRPSKVDLRSNWQMQRVDFAKVIRGTESVAGTLGDGRLSGGLTLHANRVVGPGDLFGRFDFQLDGSDAKSIPGLSEAQNLLGPVSLAGVRFDDGKAKGVIGGGRATIQEFWLHSPQVMVWAEGAVLLANQRLDLEAVIATGDFDASSTLLSTLGLVAIEYATPIGLLIEINQLLSNRMVFLDVVGPSRDPELRLKPLETIREAAATFFLQQLLPISCQLPQQRNPLAR